jgi:two-component system, chemotaxis family, chemotaxis protein CheY
MHVSETGIGRRLRLLVVEDDTDAAELVLRVASRCGYDAVSLAEMSTLEGVLRNLQPDVLTLDLCMPQMDGIEVLSRLKALGFKGHLIIISGQDGWLRKQARDLALTRGLNVADEMGKPLDLNALRSLLTRLAGNRDDGRETRLSELS